MAQRPATHYELWLNCYHDGVLHLPKTFGRIDQAWDSYNDQTLMEEVGLDEATINKIFRARLDLHSNRFVKSDRYNHYITLNFPPDEVEADRDYYVLSTNDLDHIRKSLPAYLQDLISEFASVGGDDSYYDYYPDNWEVARQLCQLLNLRQPYEEARQQLLNMANDPDYANYIP